MSIHAIEYFPAGYWAENYWDLLYWPGPNPVAALGYVTDTAFISKTTKLSMASITKAKTVLIATPKRKFIVK